MIVNARMYAVSPAATELWRALLARITSDAGVSMDWVDHAEPTPIEDLWRRADQGAVFMCGLPFARAEPPPMLVAAPVPSPPEFGDKPCYWSDFVVRADSDFHTVQDTFGGRLALTVPGSQSGCIAALSYFMTLSESQPGDAAPKPASETVGTVPSDAAALANEKPLFRELIAPTITPLGALKSVIRGDADVAPIDSYALRLLQRYRPDLTAQIRIVGRTVPTPIPPLVASPTMASGTASVNALRAAFLRAHRDIVTNLIMDKLLLSRFELPLGGSYALLLQRFESARRYWRSHPLAGVVHPGFVSGELWLR